MKILVLGSRIPYPLRDGGAIATYGMLRELANQGTEITFFSFNTRKHFLAFDEIEKHFSFCRVIPVYLDATPRATRALLALLKGKNYNIARFESQVANEKLAELLQMETFDLVHFEGLFTVPFLSTVMRHSSAPRVLRQHNLEYKIWSDLAETESNPLRKMYLRKLARSLQKFEQNAIRSFDHIVEITEEDLTAMRGIHPSADHFLYPAGISVPDELSRQTPVPHTLCHIGSMEWMPNVQGVSWFIENVLPDLRKKFPDLGFHIAGKGLQKDDPRFTQNGVINHGEVVNAAEFLADKQLVMVPLLSGSGLRMKTLEAMAIGKPVVSSTVGAGGLGAQNGKHLVIVNNATEWIEEITQLLNHPETVTTMGAEARQFVLNRFDQAQNTRALLSHYQGILSGNLNS